MGHHRCGIESREDLSQSEREAWFEPLGWVTASGLAEGHVDLHLGRSVEEAE
jgi:hypothetical protein